MLKEKPNFKSFFFFFPFLMMKITSCPLDQRRGAHKVMNLVLLMGIAPLFLKLIFTRSLFFYLSLYPKRREEEDEQVIRHPGSTPSLSVYILAFSLYRRQHPITSVWGHTHTTHWENVSFFLDLGWTTIRFLNRGNSCLLFMALVCGIHYSKSNC